MAKRVVGGEEAKKQKRSGGCLAAVFVPLVLIAAVVIYCIINFGTTPREPADVYFDIKSIARVSSETLTKRLGDPEDISDVQVVINGERVTAEWYEYHNLGIAVAVVNNETVKASYIPALFGSDTKLVYTDEKSMFELFGLTMYSNTEKTVDTGYAVRYKNLNTGITEMWIQTIDKKEKTIGQVTFYFYPNVE